MGPKSAEPELNACFSALPTTRQTMKCVRLLLLSISIVWIAGYVPTANPFVIQSRNGRIGVHELRTFSTRSRCYRWNSTGMRHAAFKEQNEGKKILYSSDGPNNGDYNEGSDEPNNYSGFNNANYLEKIERQRESDSVPNNPNIPPKESQNPDRAISIVSELKSNAALFAAFAYGSLNLPNTLTVSESKVTSVTTSLSISRPLPGSDLIRTFVILDICTLCLMISCVAASQLLIYRLTDGSYEDIDEEYYYGDDVDNNSQRKNSRDSALGRLVTTYRNEFTVARITFDLGLVSLLVAVAVRSLAIFDEEIVVPIAIVIGVTGFFLAVAYVTTYLEVFRTAENLTERPLFSILPLPFLSETDEKTPEPTNIDRNRSKNKNLIFLPISLVSVALALYFALTSGSDPTESNLSRLGPYEAHPGASKLKAVADMIDSEKGRNQPRNNNNNNNADNNSPSKNRLNIGKDAREKKALEKAEAKAAKKRAAEEEVAKKKAAEEDARKKVEEEAKKRAEEEAKKKAEEEAKKRAEEDAKRRVEEDAKRKVEEEAKKKAKEEAYKKLEILARRKAEEEANAATAASDGKVDALIKTIDDATTAAAASVATTS